jgi:hypothetical protein
MNYIINFFNNNNSITDLDISSNELDDNEIKKLKEIFKNNNNIIKLDISSNIFGIEGFKFINEIFNYKNKIQYLNLSSKNIFLYLIKKIIII